MMVYPIGSMYGIYANMWAQVLASAQLNSASDLAFIYMFFKQGLPIGSKLRFHRKFHADPELEAVGNGISTLALQIILPTACHEYHLSAADTFGFGVYWWYMLPYIAYMDPMGYGCAAFGIQPIYGMRTVQQMFFGLRPYAEWIIPGSSTYSQVCVSCTVYLYIYIYTRA